MKKKLLFFLIMFCAVAGTAAYAEAIQARITDLDVQANKMTIAPLEKQGQMPATLEVDVGQDFFQQSPYQSLNQLSVGDEITVEVSRSMFTRNWQVESLAEQQQKQAQGQTTAARQTGAQQTGQQGQAAPSTGNPSAAQGSVQGQQMGQSGQETPTLSPDILAFGRVVSKNPDTNEIVVLDYATGYERTFTVIDVDTFDEVKEGDQVQLMSPYGQAGQQSAQGQQLLQQNQLANAPASPGGNLRTQEQQPAQQQGQGQMEGQTGQQQGAQKQSGQSQTTS